MNKHIYIAKHLKGWRRGISDKLKNCSNPAREYSKCVAAKGLNVDQHHCQEKFLDLMQCLGRAKV